MLTVILRRRILFVGITLAYLIALCLQVPLSASAANATVLWAKQTSLGSDKSVDSFGQIVKDSNGNIYELTDAALPNGYHEIALLKYDLNGNVLWTQTYSESNLHVINMGIALDAEQNIYVEADSFRYGASYLTLKYSPSGSLFWVQRYTTNSPQNRVRPVSETMPLAVDSTGNSYVSGLTNSGTILLKYDTNGNLLWSRSVANCDGTSNCQRTNLILKGGEVFLTGSSYYSSDNSTRLSALKYDTDGNLQWSYEYNNQDLVGFSASTLDADGNLYLTGTDGNISRYLTLKLSQNGALIWSKLFGNQSAPYESMDVKVDSQGNVFVTGFYSSSGWVTTTVKYDPDGNMLWSANYKLKNQQARSVALSIDSQGNAYVATQGVDSDHGGTNYDFVLLKYSASGQQILETVYDSGVIDLLGAMYKDDSGNIYLAGSQCSMSGSSCIVETVKLALPPEAPTNLSAFSPTQNPSLSWSSISDAASYNIYRNGIKIDSSTMASYTDSAAPEGTNTYYTTATNSSGGESSPSNTVSVVVDRTAPIVGAPSWTANPLQQGQSTTLSIPASDGLSGIAGVTYCLNSGTPQTMTYDSASNTWQATFGSTLVANTYDVTFAAMDNSGNVNANTTDVLAVYNPTNGYVTGHAKTLPTTTDTLPIVPDASNNPTKLVVGFTNVTAPTSGSFGLSYVVKNNKDAFSLSSTDVSWVVVQDITHASILGHGNLTVYANGVKTVTQNMTVRFDIVLGVNGAADQLTVKMFDTSVDPTTSIPAYMINDVVITNGSNLMIHS